MSDGTCDHRVAPPCSLFWLCRALSSPPPPNLYRPTWPAGLLSQLRLKITATYCSAVRRSCVRAAGAIQRSSDSLAGGSPPLRPVLISDFVKRPGCSRNPTSAELIWNLWAVASKVVKRGKLHCFFVPMLRRHKASRDQRPHPKGVCWVDQKDTVRINVTSLRPLSRF